MNKTPSPEPTRRQWFGRVGRWAVGGLLVFIGGRLALRDREACINNDLCRGCPVVGGCALPQAVAWKTRRPSAPPASDAGA